MALVRGDRLKPAARDHVLRAYVHRNTVEHPYPLSGGSGAQTDAEWLREHAFSVTRTGELDSRHRRCFPAFMANVGEVPERQENDGEVAREAVKHALRDRRKSCRVED